MTSLEEQLHGMHAQVARARDTARTLSNQSAISLRLTTAAHRAELETLTEKYEVTALDRLTPMGPNGPQ